MWRTSNDFWDNWPQLKNQFAILEKWTGLGTTGSYPDGDMLPLGKIGLRAERGQPRSTAFTKDEQYTLMTLFSIFRSPLMFGGDLPSNDEFTLSLLTNKEVLYVNQHSSNNKQLFRNDDLIAWVADDSRTGDKFLALFNASDRKQIDETKAVWKSRQLSNLDSVQSVDVNIDLTGAKKLYLVTSFDDVIGFSNHNLSWIDPVLTNPKSKLKLTALNWVKAPSGRNQPSVNHDRRGGMLKVNGTEYKDGINVNGVSIIEYDLPEGVTGLKAVAGLESEGSGAVTSQNPNVQRPNNGKFLVFTEDPAGPQPPDSAEIKITFDQLGITGTHTVRDLWTGQKLGKFTDSFAASIKRHGAGLYRIH
jgi:hypothetical protein